MATLAIDHMTLDVANLSEQQARELAEHVAAGLASATGLPDSGGGAIPILRLDLPTTGGAAGDTAALARQIVAATLRAIARAGSGVP